MNDLSTSGDKSKKEKDSTMIRDFRGDRFFMQLTVDDVVCNRVYERILQE